MNTPIPNQPDPACQYCGGTGRVSYSAGGESRLDQCGCTEGNAPTMGETPRVDAEDKAHPFSTGLTKYKRLRLLARTLERELVAAVANFDRMADTLFDRCNEMIELRDILAAQTRRIEELEGALDELEKAGTHVARFGASTGPQWPRLTTALLHARSVLLTPAKDQVNKP